MKRRPMVYDYATRNLQTRISQPLYEMMCEAVDTFQTTLQDYVIYCITKEIGERVQDFPIEMLPESDAGNMPLSKEWLANRNDIVGMIVN